MQSALHPLELGTKGSIPSSIFVALNCLVDRISFGAQAGLELEVQPRMTSHLPSFLGLLSAGL